MALAASIRASLRTATTQERARLGWRDNFITILIGLWLMIGLFVDGWAHNNLGRLETFFTPWHAIFYSGFAANALWIGWLISRQWRAGRIGFAAIPQGYHLGALGVVIFGIGGVGDMLWHMSLGIEKNIAALLSPTHLLLFLGGSLMYASPFLAAWTSPDPAEDAPGFKAFLPALTSLTLMTTFASFMHMYLWSLFQNYPSQTYVATITQRYPAALRPLTYLSQSAGLQGVLITNAILLAPVLLMLRRWRLPFGAVTFLFTVNTTMMAVLAAFRGADVIIVALLAGLATDAMITIVQPWANGAWAFRTIAVAAPLVLWTLRFLLLQVDSGVAWSLELTAGITVMAALSGLALSLLMAPPAVPARLGERYSGGPNA